jgi:sigma-E factor negative regulatory protein RseB
LAPVASRISVFRVLLLLTGAASLNAGAQEGVEWLDRMNAAVEELNYEGTFVHVIGGEAETLHVVHRNETGEIGERIISLDGPGREIIRQQDKVQCILPDRKVVLLERRNDVSPLVSALPSYSGDLDPHYAFLVERGTRIAGRETELLTIKPKDEFRYGYMLWLDTSTAMPLKSQLLDEQGQIVEQILFTRIDYLDLVPASSILPTIDTTGFDWIQSPLESPEIESAVPWRATAVPSGFQLSSATHESMGGAEFPVEHLVYSDGLATVSVFIEDPQSKQEVTPGYSSVGSTNAFSLVLHGRQITAVGEVPRQTVSAIASSLIAE